MRLFSQTTRTRDRRYGADARLETFLLTTPLAESLSTPITVIVNFVQGLIKK